ncbi:MAG: hypothetical protein ACM3L6_05660 [Deltaproteobacteria bacterium]
MFSHQARWDRQLPQDAAGPGTVISATCRIEAGAVHPLSFVWRQRSFDVQRVNFRWKDKRGREELWYFSVATPHGIYEIAYSSRCLCWYLIRLIGP